MAVPRLVGQREGRGITGAELGFDDIHGLDGGCFLGRVDARDDSHDHGGREGKEDAGDGNAERKLGYGKDEGAHEEAEDDSDHAAKKRDERRFQEKLKDNVPFS